MNKILQKYGGLILGIIMLLLSVLAFGIYQTHPKFAHACIEIVSWYISIMVALIIMVLLYIIMKRIFEIK